MISGRKGKGAELIRQFAKAKILRVWKSRWKPDFEPF
jgi:hypothetical protein